MSDGLLLLDVVEAVRKAAARAEQQSYHRHAAVDALFTRQACGNFRAQRRHGRQAGDKRLLAGGGGLQAQRAQSPRLPTHAPGQTTPQPLADAQLMGFHRQRWQPRDQAIPDQEIAVRQQADPPAALPLGIEEPDALTHAIAVDLPARRRIHRVLPAIQLVAQCGPVQAQHRAQRRQLLRTRQCGAGGTWMRQRRQRAGDGHGRYQLTARLTEAVRPAPVKRSSTVLLASVPLGSAFQST